MLAACLPWFLKKLLDEICGTCLLIFGLIAKVAYVDYMRISSILRLGKMRIRSRLCYYNRFAALFQKWSGAKWLSLRAEDSALLGTCGLSLKSCSHPKLKWLLSWRLLWEKVWLVALFKYFFLGLVMPSRLFLYSSIPIYLCLKRLSISVLRAMSCSPAVSQRRFELSANVRIPKLIF